MHPIKAQSRLHPAIFAHQRRVVIQISNRTGDTISLQPIIQRPYLSRWSQPRPPGIIRRRSNRSHNHPNPIRLRQIDHRPKVILRHLRSHRPRIPSHIVRPRQNHHHRRMQVDHILPEPHHHLRSRLPANPAVHITLPRKKRSSTISPPPPIGNRIPIEHHPLFPRSHRPKSSIINPVPLQLRPIRQLLLHRRNLLRRIHRSRRNRTSRSNPHRSRLTKSHPTPHRNTTQPYHPHQKSHAVPSLSRTDSSRRTLEPLSAVP
jgi:hypothetical protein